MKKIESLTAAQKAKFPEYVEKWTRIGLDTTPANRALAEEGIIEAYKVAGLDAPRIIWCDSPMSMGLTRAIVMQSGDEIKKKIGSSVRDSVGDSVWASVRDSVGDSVWASVRASVRDSVGDSVWASVGASVRASVRDSVGDSVRDSVGDSVWASVGASVGDSVGDSVWASVGASVGDSVRAFVGDSGYGQHDANWIGFYEFFRTILNLKEQTNRLQGLQKITENAGWYLPHKGICWVSERHCVVLQDENKRLHCENGPVVKYPDGWCVYAWHGTRIPGEWIKSKETLTPQIALKWENLEQRRVACEILGWAKILDALDSKVIDADSDPQVGTLVEVSLPDSGKERFLRVKCGTGRDFALAVPPTVKTALEANSWTYGIEPKSYAIEIRT